MHGVSRCDAVECAVFVGIVDRLSDDLEAVVEAVDRCRVECRLWGDRLWGDPSHAAPDHQAAGGQVLVRPGHISSCLYPAK